MDLQLEKSLEMDCLPGFKAISSVNKYYGVQKSVITAIIF